FVEDADVFRAVGADEVAPHLLRAPSIVDGGVEDVAAARIETGSGEGALDGVLEVVAGEEVAQSQRVSLVAGGVDSVEETPAVVGQGERAEREEVLALGGDARVEDALLPGQLVLAGLRRRPGVRPRTGHA